MHRTLSLRIGELNSFLKCPLCKGYLIDSYTIKECLHSFCKSCIIKYIKRKECCPVCKINIIKDRMNLYLKPDVNLQCIVYKIVPELFKKEMKRRRHFYLTHPKAIKYKEAIGELDDDIFVLDKYTDISLSIEYSETGLADVCDSARFKELDPPSPKIYLQCPATLSINLLKKFLSLKYGLENFKNLDVMYDDKPLNKDITLLDVSYIYAWRRTAPMRLFYRINNQNSANEVKKNCQNKQNVLISIDNNFERISDETNQELNLSKKTLFESENENTVNNFVSKENANENFSTSSKLEDCSKTERKSLPQTDLKQSDCCQDSNFQIQTDLSTNESILKENLDNSMTNFSNIKEIACSNQTSSSQNSNIEDNLTITNMVESIKSVTNVSTRLETVSNSDKENEDESRIKKEATNETEFDISKLKKTKIVKSKKELNSNEEINENAKKKKPNKSNDYNPTKKQKLSETFHKSLTNEHLNKELSENEFNSSFPKKISSQITSSSNYSSNTSTSQSSQLAMLQNFQLMPLMYPWKSLEYSPSYSNFQHTQQMANQHQTSNMNSQVLMNQKYASHVFDFLQNKAPSYQNFYHSQTQNSQQQQQPRPKLHSQYPCLGQSSGLNHFNQFNYIEEFKKPLANFASLIQEATSYQNNVFAPKILQNDNSSMDSLKETQLKISESCSLVNE